MDEYNDGIMLFSLDLNTDVKELENKIIFQNEIFPNPSSNFISIPESMENIQKISIYSVLGNKIEGIVPNGNKIDISSLSSGVYFLKAGDKVYKFVKI